jgi:MYXO-CTERM domain-containing protein
MNAKTITATCFVALTLSSSAWAGPFYTEEELFELASVVADVEVLSTSCGEVTTYDYGVVTHYSSMVRTVQVLKGELPAEFDYRSHTTAYGEGGEAGCSEAEHPVGQGWVGRAYLKEVGPEIYYVVDWGGMVGNEAESAPEPLPVCQEPAPPENPTEPSDPTNPSDPSDPTSPTQTTQSSTEAAGCSAGGNASTTGTWLAALALALGFGRRRRNS